MSIQNSRQRVLTALSRREPDRVPVDLGAIADGSLHVDAHNALKKYLGIEEGETEFIDITQQTVMPDERVLEMLEVDTRIIALKTSKNLEQAIEEDDDSHWFIDEWGIKWKKPKHGFYFDMVEHPLENANIKDLDDYSWPDPDDPTGYEGLGEKAKDLFSNTEYAIVGNTQLGSAFELNWCLTGLERFLTDMFLNPKFIEELVARSLEIQVRIISNFLNAVGDYIQILGIGDDLGMQTGPLISPDLYRRVIKPHAKRLVRLIKSQTDAKILCHSCGSIVPFIPDFVEYGIDVLHPVQVSAKDMDSRRLKERFGDQISFWGAVDTQRILPYGTPKDVEKEVKKRIHDLAPGGGYVLAAVHNIQRDVPPENIMAMFKAAKEYGEYPIFS